VSNVFRILHTTVIKIWLFFHFTGKNEKDISDSVVMQCSQFVLVYASE